MNTLSAFKCSTLEEWDVLEYYFSMAKNLYEILGIHVTASLTEIKTVYRQLAKQYHPDANPGYAAQFREITNAYALLSDVETRQKYDAGHIDEGGNLIPGGRGDLKRPFNAEDIFKDFFEQQAQHKAERTDREAYAQDRSGKRGEDLACVLKISFWEACKGSVKRIPRRDGTSIEVEIPAGVEDGQLLRVKGKGYEGAGGGSAGDLLLEIHVAPNPAMRRDGKDIYMTLPLTLAELINGTILEIPTVRGPVNLNIPAKTKPGTTLRLSGKGIKPSLYQESGDTFVILDLAFPENIDKNFENWISEWYKNNPQDPRKHIKYL